MQLEVGTIEVPPHLIRPIALGRSNCLFAGSLRAGKRGAAVMSLLHSARINGHDPYACFKDVLERLPTHPASRIEGLLPHRGNPSAGDTVNSGQSSKATNTALPTLADGG